MGKVIRKMMMMSSDFTQDDISAEAAGAALSVIPSLVRQAVSLAFLGRRVATSRAPDWLRRASALRVHHSEVNGASLSFAFAASTLGETAEEFFRDEEFFVDEPPDPNATGLDLLGDVLADIDRRNIDGDRFDRAFLRRVRDGLRRILRGRLDELLIEGGLRPARITSKTIATAADLLAEIPASRRLRVSGVLERIRPRSATFTLSLIDGSTVRGTFARESLNLPLNLLGSRATVFGRAIYRASGRVLRIDADEIAPATATAEDDFFTTIPRPIRSTINPFLGHEDKGGVSSIFGRWPGDESDEEVRRALEELS